jgi:S1-C subfamily serine protease
MANAAHPRRPGIRKRRHAANRANLAMNRYAPASFVAILVAIFLATAATTMQARRDPAPDSRPDPQYSYAAVVRRVAPSVVSIYATKVPADAQTELDASGLRGPSPEPNAGRGPTRTPSAENPQDPSAEEATQSIGSGVIVDPTGLVVTASHVVSGATQVRIVTSDQKEFSATVVLNDAKTDLALLRLAGAAGQSRAIELGNSDALNVGDTVLALGNPFGIGETVTHGIISALGRNESEISDSGSLIQTDAAINPGNSGGALVDVNSRLIGINTAIVSRSGGSEGVGFAIPVNVVRRMVATTR